MKKTTVLTSIAALAMVFGFTACAEVSQSDINAAVDSANGDTSRIYFPEKGIVCDRENGFCADREGVSLTYTKEELGQAAQDKLMGYPNLITSTFTLSNGVYCDTHVARCFNNRWKEKVDTFYTQKLF